MTGPVKLEQLRYSVVRVCAVFSTLALCWGRSGSEAMLLAWLTCGSMQVGTQELLMSRGLTRREADSVGARHRRRHKAQLDVAELDAVLNSLDGLELHPEQATHLLRSTPLQELLAATPFSLGEELRAPTPLVPSVTLSAPS